MRDGIAFRSILMGGSGTTELTWLCDVETGTQYRVHTSNTAQTVAQYYAYASSRYNGPDGENNTILIRWHRNINTKQLSLIVVAQSDGSTTMGPINITVNNLNAAATVAVSDDAGGATKSGNTVTANLSWQSDRTDGFAITSIDTAIIPNITIVFDNPHNTMRLKIQTSPNVFSYIRQDKLTTLQFRSTNTNPCARYEYPPAQSFIVDTPAELSAATNSSSTPPTPADVFNTWGRYAGVNWYPYGTPPEGEATNWIYDSGTNRIRCTVNSANYIGFVSPETLGYYQLTTRLGSGNNDDDSIGIVMAVVIVGGVPNTLCAIRTNGGNFNSSAWVLVRINGQTATVLADGGTLAPTTQKNGEPTNGTGWNGSGQTVVRVKRDNRTFTATCSQFGSDTLDPTTTLTYTVPEGSVLDVPASYGFMCYSQNDSHYDVLNFTGGLDQSSVYDFSHNPPRVYEYNGSAWVHNPARSVFEELGQPRYVTNPSTGKTYYLDNNTATIVP